jgi:hypothetical protein
LGISRALKIYREQQLIRHNKKALELREADSKLSLHQRQIRENSVWGRDLRKLWKNASEASVPSKWYVSDAVRSIEFGACGHEGDHNICGRHGRRDAWFTDGDGWIWWGVNYSAADGWNELLHCKRTSTRETYPPPRWPPVPKRIKW